MSRDGWMKKRASAGDDNGWAERVSVESFTKHIFSEHEGNI